METIRHVWSKAQVAEGITVQPLHLLKLHAELTVYPVYVSHRNAHKLLNIFDILVNVGVNQMAIASHPIALLKKEKKEKKKVDLKSTKLIPTIFS